MFWLKRKNNKILFEDALKHVYDCEYRKNKATTVSLSGALRLRPRKIISLVTEMEKKNLLRVTGDGIELTPHGRAWALQVIRAHRLWESYLANEVGLPLEELHDKAEEKEHTISPEEANEIEAQLGFPTEDPHGDPIPTADHKVPVKKSTALTDWPKDKLARIVHIEDEPQTVFTQILSEGLFVDTFVKILSSNQEGLHIWTSLHKCWIAPVVAANIFVDEAPDWVVENQAEPLSILKPGEKGKVVAMNSQGLTRRRFMDLGILPGTIIEAALQSAFSEPMAYLIRGSLIALRKEQTSQILIQPLKDTGSENTNSEN